VCKRPCRKSFFFARSFVLCVFLLVLFVCVVFRLTFLFFASLRELAVGGTLARLLGKLNLFGHVFRFSVAAEYYPEPVICRWVAAAVGISNMK
jgi:hypothetical protein